MRLVIIQDVRSTSAPNSQVVKKYVMTSYILWFMRSKYSNSKCAYAQFQPVNDYGFIRIWSSYEADLWRVMDYNESFNTTLFHLTSISVHTYQILIKRDIYTTQSEYITTAILGSTGAIFLLLYADFTAFTEKNHIFSTE